MKNIRHKVQIGNVIIGGGNPVVIQSMTNTNTADINATANQIKELSNAGAEIVRITVNDEKAAEAVPAIREKLNAMNCNTPLVGDFHYNGHELLTKYPDCAKTLDKYRINPGNVGFGNKHDEQFAMMIKCAVKYNKPVRIGVNWGSLDKSIATKLMDENNQSQNPKTTEEIQQEAMILSALTSAKKAEELGLPANKIVVSCKTSRVQDLIAIYKELANRSSYALHLGLTEAGIGSKGIVATSCALAILLQEGIGDTIRASLTPAPSESRTNEVVVCQEILQCLGLRSFMPQVTSCPGCGRTSGNLFQNLAEKTQTYLRNQMPLWKDKYKGVENMNVAVMGCIVNGPGESKHADIGISLPGNDEEPIAPVFIDGKKAYTLRGENIAEEFQAIIEEYVKKRYV